MLICVLLVLMGGVSCRADAADGTNVCSQIRVFQEADRAAAVGDTLFRRPRRDPWLARDKFLHCTVSAGLAGAGYLSFRHLADLDEPRSRWAASLTTMGIGLLKETRDRRRPNSWFSLRDLVADLVGVLFVIGVTYH